MTRDLHLQVKEVNIVEEPKTISRNFVSFAFFVAKSSVYKRFNSSFGVQSTSLPRAEADSGCAITVRNGQAEAPCDYSAEQHVVPDGKIMLRNSTWFQAVRSWCGPKEWMSVRV